MHAPVYVYVCICVTVCVYMYVCLCLYMCDCEYLCIVRLCVHVPVYLMYMSDCVSTCMCTFGGGKWFIISNRHSEGSVLRQNTKKLIQKQLLKSSTESNLEAFPHLRQSKHCSGKQWK